MSSTLAIQPSEPIHEAAEPISDTLDRASSELAASVRQIAAALSSDADRTALVGLADSFKRAAAELMNGVTIHVERPAAVTSAPQRPLPAGDRRQWMQLRSIQVVLIVAVLVLPIVGGSLAALISAVMIAVALLLELGIPRRAQAMRRELELVGLALPRLIDPLRSRLGWFNRLLPTAPQHRAEQPPTVVSLSLTQARASAAFLTLERDLEIVAARLKRPAGDASAENYAAHGNVLRFVQRAAGALAKRDQEAMVATIEEDLYGLTGALGIEVIRYSDDPSPEYWDELPRSGTQAVREERPAVRVGEVRLRGVVIVPRTGV